MTPSATPSDLTPAAAPICHHTEPPPPSHKPRPAHTLGTAVCLTCAAFLVYFCMYGVRKPFAVGMYEGAYFLGTGIRLKTALVLSQLLGYAFSKLSGIKFCSEASRHNRAWWLLGCVAVSELALIAFALVPGDWKVLAMFVNGLPLGLVWGLVIAYLEGRKLFEALFAGLSCSFILSSGAVKDVGALLLQHSASESWMPAIVGGIFLVPFAIGVWLLERAPNPSQEDIAARVQREPMCFNDRLRFFRKFWPALIPLIALYALLTAFRDYRDNYGVDIYDQLGYGDSHGIFIRTETPIAFGIFLVFAFLTLVKDHRRAVQLIYGAILAGLLIMGAATSLHLNGRLDGFAWMLLVGFGSYLAYVPFGAILFDRLLAAAQTGGTAIFAIYLTDSIAYLGTVLIQLQHDFLLPKVSHLDFLRDGSALISGAGILLLLIGWWFTSRCSRLTQAGRV